MSKYYGQSVIGTEKITVIDDKNAKLLPIQRIVEENMNHLKIPCFDEKGEVVLGNITDLIKHKTQGKVLKVTTRSGRSISVTDYHSLFTLGKGGIEDVKTSDLKPGESHIAVPRTLPEPPTPTTHINLLDALKENDHGLRIKNSHLYVQHAKNKLGHKKVANILDVKEKYVYDIIGKKVMLPVHKFLKLIDAAQLDYDEQEIAIATKGKALPVELKLTENLCAFFGVWIAEGSYTNKNEVRISVHRNEESFMRDLCTELFGPVTIYRKPGALASDIYICSGVLGKIMKHVLGFTSGARKKLIPEFVFNLPKQQLAAFLRGYISGDGSLNLTTPAPTVEVVSESPELINDIAYLMLRFGIVGKIYGRKHRPQKRYCFANGEDLENFCDIGFFSSEKNHAIYKYLETLGARRRDRVPMTDTVQDVVDNTYELRAWKDCKTIGREVLQEHAPALVQTFKDIYWDKVMSVEEVEAPEYVYDIGVDPCHNFIAGYGGIFAHNSEENLRKKFEEAEKNAPSIIFIDELDAIASKREESKGEVERRVVAQLLTMMDGLKSRGKVVVIAATNIPNQIDPALRRPGRFDRELEIGVPQAPGRLNILKIHTRNMPLEDKGKGKVDMKKLAAITHGFVGADLSALAKEAAMIVLRRVLPDINLQDDDELPTELLEKLIIHQDDFLEALKVVRPSALREVLVEAPNVTYKDIGGLDDVKQELTEAVEWPLKHKAAFNRLGVKPPKGVLMYGPPGTGKTMLAKAIAKESEANFIPIKGPELLSKWVGESEKAIRKIFEKARQTSPTVVFFDEIDSVAPHRSMNSDSNVTERVVNQLLTEMDGLQELNDVVVIASTNRPDMVDTALLRPGRFDRILLVPVPDKKSRKQIFKVHTDHMKLNKDVKIDALVQHSEGYVGADIEAIAREAAILALRDNIKAKDVKMKYFEASMKKVRPSVNKEIEKAYKEIEDKFTKAHGQQMNMDKPSYYG
ncbi:MAG: AAA family ATPase [Candidatus Woesearchaeota archaeon]|nr:AAA family ATPase [Candidatus Woesearchaeota archaeon]